MEYTLHDIASLLGLTPPASNATIRHLLTDSRSLESPEDTLFFAIPTAGNDGHRYITQLYNQGVRNFVVNRRPELPTRGEDATFFIVPDTIKALQKIAGRPAEFKGEILAVTGSRGKTTLKEWLYQLMEPLADISRSPRSYNSQIGVPLSMWGITPDTRLAIIEAGISRCGEMPALAECIQPDTVILTNILSPHSEGFVSDRQKAHEKALLATGDRTSTVIYNIDNALIDEAVRNLAPGKKRLTWSLLGNAAADVIISSGKVADEVHLDYKWHGESYSLSAPLEGDTDMENAANALVFMLHRGISPAIIAERFKSLHKIGTRLNVSEGINGCTVINDQYTSDFSSLGPALDFLRRRQTPGQSATLVLSDIHHESGVSQKVYKEIANLARRAGVERLIGIGKEISANKSLFGSGALFFESVQEALAELSPSDFSSEAILIKGSPEYNLGALAEMLERRRHETVLEVNLDALIRNYNYFRRQLPPTTGIVCMVKASGYGAGSYEIAKTLQDAGAAYLAVAVLDEGMELRRQGITMPIMVMNPKAANYGAMFANRLEPEIYSFDMLFDMIKEARKNKIEGYPIHIKLDTGMHRMGFTRSELSTLTKILSTSPEVSVRSVFSHLATADCPDMDDYTERQLHLFEEYTAYLASKLKTPFMRHILNSAGILRYPQYHFDMVRLGIGLYGANTLPAEIEKPLSVVSTLRTVIIAIGEYEAGESIGYGRRGILERKSRIATIPIGYADGMNRHFGRGAISVVVNGKKAPTVGNICMDACMIDVTDIDCKVGDSVEIFGAEAPLQRLADTLDTIPYEILTSISPRVKRIYYRE